MKSDEIGICEQSFYLGEVDCQTVRGLVAGIRRGSAVDRGSGAFLMNISGRGLMAVVVEAHYVYHIARLCDECMLLGDQVLIAGFGDPAAIPGGLSFGAWKRLAGRRRPAGTGLELVPRYDHEGASDIVYGGDVLCRVRPGKKSYRHVFENLLAGRRIGARFRKGDAEAVKALAKAPWESMDPFGHSEPGPTHVCFDGGRMRITRLSGPTPAIKEMASASLLCLAEGSQPGSASADYSSGAVADMLTSPASNPVTGMWLQEYVATAGDKTVLLVTTYADGSIRAAQRLRTEQQGRPAPEFKPADVAAVTPLLPATGHNPGEAEAEPVSKPEESKREVGKATEGPGTKKPVTEPVAKKPGNPVAKPNPKTAPKPAAKAKAKAKAEPVAKPVAEPKPEPKPKPDSGMSVTVVPSLVRAKDIPALRGMRVTPLRDSRRRKVGYVGRKGGRVVLVWREWFASMPDSKQARADVLRANRVTA